MPLVPPYIEALRPYEAGRSIEEVQRAYGLSHIQQACFERESAGPFTLGAGCHSPGAHERLEFMYPNSGLDLRRVLAERCETKVENVIAGSGSGKHHPSNIIRTFLGDEDEVLHYRSRIRWIPGASQIARRGVPHRAVSRLAL